MLGVDFDSELVSRRRESGRTVVYGDAVDSEFVSTLPLSQVRGFVSSLSELTVNLALLHALSRHDYSGLITTTAYLDRDAIRLKNAGSDLILMPFMDAAKEAVHRLCEQLQSLPAGKPAPEN